GAWHRPGPGDARPRSGGHPDAPGRTRSGGASAHGAVGRTSDRPAIAGVALARVDPATRARTRTPHACARGGGGRSPASGRGARSRQVVLAAGSVQARPVGGLAADLSLGWTVGGRRAVVGRTCPRPGPVPGGRGGRTRLPDGVRRWRLVHRSVVRLRTTDGVEQSCGSVVRPRARSGVGACA